MNVLPNRCPICGGEIQVTRFHCDECDVTIEGRFTAGKFANLSSEQMQFIEVFIRNEGKLSRMESEMELSYPTLRSRLQDIICALGYEPGKDDTPEKPAKGISEAERKRILEELNQGRISAEQAMQMLKPQEE